MSSSFNESYWKNVLKNFPELSKGRRGKCSAGMMYPDKWIKPAAGPLRSMVRGCPSLGNPFGRAKVHWTFAACRLTHSYGYASSGDRPTRCAKEANNSDKIARSDFQQRSAATLAP